MVAPSLGLHCFNAHVHRGNGRGNVREASSGQGLQNQGQLVAARTRNLKIQATILLRCFVCLKVGLPVQDYIDKDVGCAEG